MCKGRTISKVAGGEGGRDGKNVYTEAIRLEKIPARGNHQETPIDVKIIPANRVERN